MSEPCEHTWQGALGFHYCRETVPHRTHHCAYEGCHAIDTPSSPTEPEQETR